MNLDNIGSGGNYKLQKILKTLNETHGIRINFAKRTIDQILHLQETTEIEKKQIVGSSSFNSYMTNPRYAATMLILEACRIYLKEIAPKRRPKKAVNESFVTPEGDDLSGIHYGVTIYRDQKEIFNVDLMAPSDIHAAEFAIDDYSSQTGDLSLNLFNADTCGYKDLGNGKVRYDFVDQERFSIKIIVQEVPEDVMETQDTEGNSTVYKTDSHILGYFTGTALQIQKVKTGKTGKILKDKVTGKPRTDICLVDTKGQLPSTTLISSVNPNWDNAKIIQHLKSTYPRDMQGVKWVDGELDEEVLIQPAAPNQPAQPAVPAANAAPATNTVSSQPNTAPTTTTVTSNPVPQAAQVQGQVLGEKFKSNQKATNMRKLREASYGRMGLANRPTDEIANAQTLLAAQDISDRLQKIAEQAAKMGVEDLMPLVDVMKRQFGIEIAQSFNEIVKAQLDTLLQTAITAKDATDNAIMSLQSGQVPTAATDLDSAKAPEWDMGGMDEPSADGEEHKQSKMPADDFTGMGPDSGPTNSPLGRNKKAEHPQSEKGESGWSLKPEAGQEKPKSEEPLTESVVDTEMDKAVSSITVEYLTPTGQKGEVKFTSQAAYKEWAGKHNHDVKSIDVKYKHEHGETKIAPKAGTFMSYGKLFDTKVFHSVADCNKWLELNSDWGHLGTDEDGHHHVAHMADEGRTLTESLKLFAKMQAQREFNRTSGISSGAENRRAKAIYESLLPIAPINRISRLETVTKLNQQAIKKIDKKLEEHRTLYTRRLNENNQPDLLGFGQGIEADVLEQKKAKIVQENREIKAKLASLIQESVRLLNKKQVVLSDINLVAESAKTPWGVIWSENKTRKSQFFESQKARDYWVSLNGKLLRESVLINPENFKNTIQSLKKTKLK